MADAAATPSPTQDLTRHPAEPRRSSAAGIGEGGQTAAKIAARRRIRLLLFLAVAAALGWGLVAGHVLAWPWAVPASCLLLVDLVALRIAARRRRSRPGRQETAAAAAPTRRRAEPPLPTLSTPPVAPPAPTAPPVERPKRAAEDGTWMPVPVPPPVYTLKPVVPRPELMPRERRAPIGNPVPAVAEDDLAPLDLDAVLERRRAVNG